MYKNKEKYCNEVGIPITQITPLSRLAILLYQFMSPLVSFKAVLLKVWCGDQQQGII